jgi:prepilin-type processing-associated H-X9-DG protein
MASRRRGVTLLDLMVLVLVVGVLIGLVLPAIQESRRTRCRAYCDHNLRNVGLGLQGYLNTKGHYPNAGTFREAPGATAPASSTILGCFTDVTSVPFLPPQPPPSVAKDFGPLRSWVVDILPYIDANDLANAWDHNRSYASTFADPASGNPPNVHIASKSIGILICPENTTLKPASPNLSYVVNGGFSRWVGDPTIGWRGRAKGGFSTRAGPDWGMDVASQTGVMFLGTDTGKAPWDRRTIPQSIVDGTSQTILATENLRAGFSPGSPATGGLATGWACPHPNVVMFIASDRICPSGRCPTGGTSPTLTPGPYGDGDAWALANSPSRNPHESINARAKDAAPEGAFPYPSSNHAGGVNVLFCDGSVRFISETIDGTVYANLITPAGRRLPQAIRQLSIQNCEF